MIVATAGHVNHGKTSLVRTLTGIDTDRLPEEQRRGMTIEPGFAHACFGDAEPIAFVDLPGHERFMRHLLAGITAADVALLVIAADDGPMPQTREHLAVLDLLGLRRVAVVLSKVDRVDAQRLAQVSAEVATLLAPTALRGSPVFPVALPVGDGLPALRDRLATWQRGSTPRSLHGRFRMAIDRAFVQPGVGLVVAGAVRSGQVRVGDALACSASGETVRVRGIHVHGAATEYAQAGQRCALNLVATAGTRVLPGRGDWLLDAGLLPTTDRLDVALRWLPDAPRPLQAGDRLQWHVGATQVPARLVPLSPPRLQPGERGLVQLLLDRPVSALWGDRGLVRDASLQRVVGGGCVVDPWAPARGRARPGRLQDLAALALDDPDQALAALVAGHPEGVEWSPFARARDLDADAWRQWPAGKDMVAAPHARGLRLLTGADWQALQERLVNALGAAHAAQRDSVGLAEAVLLREAGAVDGALARAALRAQLQAGAIVRDSFVLRLPGHRARLSPDDEALLSRVIPELLPGGLRPLPPGELAPRLGLELQPLSAFLQRAAALGHLVQIAGNRFFPPATLQALVAVARQCAAAAPDGRFDARTFRDASGLGRNLSIQVLEFFDRSGVTRYAGERRTMAPADDA